MTGVSAKSRNLTYAQQPPEPETDTANITAEAVCNKLSRLERGIVPPWVQLLTAGIDVGGRRIHWAVLGWGKDMRSVVVDYGIDPVHSPMVGALTSTDNLEHTQRAILTSLISWRDWQQENDYIRSDTGAAEKIALVLVDAGWMSDPVYAFCGSAPGEIYRPSKGFGTGSLAAKYRTPGGKASSARRGRHWHATRPRPREPWLYNLDADHYKQMVHSGFMTPADQAGSIALFGAEPRIHRTYGDQIAAEIWTREVRIGRRPIEGFIVRGKQNHFLDATAGAYAGADMLGLAAFSRAKERKKTKLSEKQAARRHG